MRITLPGTRLRRYAAATGSLALVGTLFIAGLAGTGGVGETDAAWTDREHARAPITTEWPEAFASVVAGSAKSSDTARNGFLVPPYDVTYESQFRWTQQLSQAPETIDTTSDDPGTGQKFSRTFDQRLQGVGNPVNDSSPHLLENTGGGIDTVTNALHNWRASKNFNNSNPTYPGTIRCLVINDEYGSANHADPRCGLGNNFAAASNTTDAYGFSIASGSAYITHLNSANLHTAVTCNENSATAHPPTGRIDLGRERGGVNPYLSYSGTSANRVRTIWANGQPGSPNGFDLDSGEISPAWGIAPLGPVLDPYARVMPIITQESSGPGEQPYAISEIAAYVEVANNNLILPDSLRAKMYFVLSRSECGVKRVSDSTLPAQRDVFPTTLPGGNGLTPYSGTGFQPAAQQSPPLTMRDLRESDASTSELPPVTTVTSPSEHTTASETTTSAPPNPDDRDDSSSGTNSPTTSRSAATTRNSPAPPPNPQPSTPTSTAAPDVVIPRDPGTLGAAARTEDVATVTVQEEELVVVVVGNTVPNDARVGARALHTWLGGGAPATTWAMFTATDPDEDGWRWAAINQTSGTVVYIR